MRKLKLDLDELLVESFTTTDAESEARGTVYGREATGLCTQVSCVDSCGPSCMCSQDPTCEYACTQVTCGYTCSPYLC